MVVDSTLKPSLPSTAESDPDLRPGQVVGEYEVEHKLGQGGFGAVFKAVHPLIGKQVAIKVLSHRFSVDPQMVSRFMAEARAVNQIRHPNIIDIFSFKTLEDGRLYYVMEYLDGEPLDRRLARGRLSLAEAIPILRGIARALDAAHAKGIAHRDLKAENVFLATHPDGVFPKLLDFGIAKLLTRDDELAHKTRTGAPMGTPHYMSPEQCHGRHVDHRTDMYAFGVLAYLMLTSVYPLDGEDFMAILMRQVHDEPPPPSSHVPELPVGVDAAVAWLMRKEPAARPETLMAAVRMLEKVASGEAVSVPPAPAPPSGAASDAQSTLPLTAGKRTPADAPPPAGNLRSPDALAPTGQPTGQPTAAALPAAPVAAASLSGELPVTVPPEDRSAERPAPGSPASAEVSGARTPAARGGGGRPAGALSEERRRPAPHVLLAGGALLAAAGIVAVIVVRSGGRDAAPAAPPQEPAPVAAATSAAAPAAMSAAAPAAAGGAAPVRPADVVVTIEGPPPGTEVRRASVLVGMAPGKFQLPRSEAPSILVLSADGHFPETLTVTPAEDLTRTVTLRPRAPAGTGTRPGPAGGTAGKPAGGSSKPAGGGSGGKPAGGGSGGKPAGGGSGEEPTDEILQFPPPEKPEQPVQPAPKQRS